MREINNTNLNLQKTDLKIDKPQIEEKVKTEKEYSVNDFSNPKAESLGRSQIISGDNLKKDVQFMLEHTKAVNSAEKFFNMTYADLLSKDVPNAYEKAAAMATMFAQEIASK